MNNSYELTTLNDVLRKVPADRIKACFEELAVAFTQMASVIESLQLAMPGVDVSSMAHVPDSHTWVDDGLREVSVSVGVDGESDMLNLKTTLGDEQ